MDYTALVFTPYSVRMGIVSIILSDIKKIVPYKMFYQGQVSLREKDVKIIYPKLIKKFYFPKIIQCLTGGEARFVLVAAPKIHSKINRLKGKFFYVDGVLIIDGLRRQYQKNGLDFEFIFHSTDSNAETDEIGRHLFKEKYQIMFQRGLKIQ
ncbi:hypothetical protein COS18_04470 [Candidatus Falkowbacteria bacterium CG02_land_8_20_14_3_00_36_14]|uniref:Uncharacterized protein n=1 Tax=Candidatus Falkowbacteria bacterium CG02_land_8_20_14_3_00_36_14 TaxID=1974560 RepID=A0A2M7DLG1_9BACT|nr:MAG: hypothetical protein COS18_04470 [Candidatus Falkowbacteria bacterium CG02_land_8_20_14_3_00_36_14]